MVTEGVPEPRTAEGRRFATLLGATIGGVTEAELAAAKAALRGTALGTSSASGTLTVKTPDALKPEVAGSESEPKPKRASRKRDPSLAVRGGRREMKAYTVTEDQLENLGTLQLSTALCFSASASFLTFWLGVRQDVAFSSTGSGAASDYWQGLATGALIGAIVLAVLGVWQFVKGRTTIGKIKRDTIHD